MRLRPALIATAVLLLLVLIVPLILDKHGDTRERVGDFEVYKDRESFAGHSRTTWSLHHGRRTIAENVTDVAVHPRHADRVLYGTQFPGGTFYFDAATGRTLQVSGEAHVLGPMHADPADPADSARFSRWSPDGRRVVLAEMYAPGVVDLQTGEGVRLADAVGDVHLRAWAWSPSGQRIAAVTEVERDMRTRQDLVAIEVATLAVEYVATIEGGQTLGATLWEARDFRWDGECLLATGEPGRTLSHPPSARWWTPGPAGMRERSTACP